MSTPVLDDADDDALALAALLARDLDLGVRATLRQPGSVLRLDEVVARVGRESDDPAAAWLGEVRLRPGDPLPGGVSPPQEEPAAPRVAAAVARLPVSAVLGVGPRWAKVLTGAGWRTVGTLADAPPADVLALAERESARLPVVALARARACALVAPADLAPRLAELRVLDVLDLGPARTARRAGVPLLAALEVWDVALRLGAVLDERVLDLTVAAATGTG
ncbi:hypothetical protein [Aquipuribacter nitratireducens]|uniref:Uncharacterized protein n=1 Tax=Aquipuribacter nitratireducens TaxID=650104 RepID=A0ABW0GN53_9MICO